jgi:hypothetical protein
VLCFVAFTCVFSISKAQSGDTALHSLPSNYLSQVSSKLDGISDKLDKKSGKALSQLQKQEDKIRRKLSRLDSSKAKQVFGDAEQKYNELQQKLNNPSSLTQYIPYLDTLKTSLKFLENNKGLLGKVKDLDKSFSGASGKLKSLETSLANAENIKAFIKQRRGYLKEQLGNLPFASELKKLNKQAYYYSAQLQEYKSLLKDQKKLERKALELLANSKQFQNFMRKNSQLASLFRLPDVDNPANAASLAGLQTRASVNQLIQDRIGSSADAQAMFRQNVQGAQSQLASLKEKVSKYSNGNIGNSSSDIEQPDFKPNEQKTKSFLKRLEYGGNVQSQRARQMFPITSDIALSLGYKLNDKSLIGVGASYKLGLGKGWNDIKLSNEGVGIRSFIDWKLKGSIYLSGGYEQNYRTAFYSLQQLRGINGWQSSGLIGLSKKYSISKKLKGNVQLLWDFLSYQQRPQTQVVLFRVGYAFK